MTTRPFPPAFHRQAIARQKGVVLMIALIVLVAMTLAGLALIRSVDTTTIIAGNLGFQQSATYSGDSGTEAAVAWLQNQQTNTPNNLFDQVNVPNQGYFANRADPAIGQSWDAFWTTTLDPTASSQAVPPVTTAKVSNGVWVLPTDAAGNTVSYVIHRLCQNTGSPVSTGTGCATSQAIVTSTGSSKGTGVIALQHVDQYYYRITTRITGPRNTVSYIQAIVAL